MNKEEISNMFETLTEQWGDTDNYVNDLIYYAKELQQENKQLKDNWNKLKDYIAKEYYIFLPLEATAKYIMILLNKMQELEKGEDNE